MLENDTAKGIIGAFTAFVSQYIDVFDIWVKVFAGIGGSILLILSLRSKYLDIKLKRKKLEDEGK